MNSLHAGQQRSRGLRGAFRAWRRSRPFAGGLLLLLAGLELVSIPLSGVLIRGQARLVIYIGIGGVSGVLTGVLLAAAAIMVWASPVHRVFYGIAGIVLGIISFPASNLGGFFLGMLLAVTGGALAFAWTPAGPAPLPFPPPDGPGPACADASASGTVPGMNATAASMPAATAGTRGRRTPPGRRRRAGPLMLAAAAMPAVIAAGLTGSGAGARAASSCALGVLCPPPGARPANSGASASGTGDSRPSPSPAPSSRQGMPGLLPPLAPTAAGKTAPAGSPPAPAPGANSASGKAPAMHAPAPSGVVAPSATSVLTAKSATLAKFRFAGDTTLPAGGGGSEQVMEFTAGSAAMSGVGIAVTQNGATVSTTSTTLGFSGGMTLYTTRLCGHLGGLTPDICFTPSTASEAALKLASALGKSTPVTMTSVTAGQPAALAGTARWGAYTMGAA